MEPSHILADFALNYNGAIYMIQETVPYMPSGGRIINIGAMGSQIYIPAQPAYCAAKAALDHSTRFLAAEVCFYICFVVRK
jgi:NAD(P)-dependent dehydrogenase (short-subunit alcohol dehydrogenase family)